MRTNPRPESRPRLATHPGPARDPVARVLQHQTTTIRSAPQSGEQSTAAAMLGSDLVPTACLFGQARPDRAQRRDQLPSHRKRAPPQSMPTRPSRTTAPPTIASRTRFHPSDKGYQLIFDAFRNTPGRPVPNIPAVDGSWPSPTKISALHGDTEGVSHPPASTTRAERCFTFRLEQATEITIAIRRRDPAQHNNRHAGRAGPPRPQQGPRSTVAFTADRSSPGATEPYSALPVRQ